MRIELIGPIFPYRGGIAHHTAQLATALDRAGHQAQVTSFRRQYPLWLYPGTSDKDPSPGTLDISPAYTLDPLYPWTWESTFRRIVDLSPDLVIMQWWTTFWGPPLGYLGRRFRKQGIPRVFLIHNVLPHEVRPWDRWLARLALGTGTAFIAQSKRESGRLKELLPGAPIVPTKLPLYTIFSQGQIPPAKARETLKIAGAGPVLLFFGIVRPYKGLRDLLKACALLKDRGRAFQLVVAGEFWESKEAYKSEIDRLGLTDRVHIHDRYIPNEEVPIFFSAADMFAAPYTAGTQSAAVTSALSYGLPVVVSETIADSAADRGLGEQVWIAPSENPAGLADALEAALQAKKSSPGDLSMIADESWRDLVTALLTLAAEGAEGG